MHFCPDELIPLQPFIGVAQHWVALALRHAVARGKRATLYVLAKFKNS